MTDKLVIGCGYLGQRVALLWRGAGCRVFATTRRTERAAKLLDLGLQPIRCDVLDPPSLPDLPGVQSVVYCVGLDRDAGHLMRTIYVNGLANVLDEYLSRPVEARPRRFVYVSSTSVYSQTAGEEVNEESPTEPMAEPGRVVLEAEQLLRQRWPAAVVLRFAGIYGPGRLIGSQRLLAGEPMLGDPDGWLNLIHVDDGAAAVLAADERGGQGVTYIVSDDRPVRRREFYGRLAKLLSAAPPGFESSKGGANRRTINLRLRKELHVDLRIQRLLRD